MNLEILPERTAGAAENMAIDFLLLQRYPGAAAPRFRHYGWRRPAFTFGYAQKIAFVRAQLPAEGAFDLCRRPTGGGIVDHRDDWTYALVIPRGHPLEELRAAQSYRAVHEALAAALRAQGVPAVLSEPQEAAETAAAGVCFERAEIADVVHDGHGAKIAGAAQKRNKHGLLFQGSIAKAAAGATVDWDGFGEAFVARLAARLDAAPQPTPWPEFNDAEVEGLTEQYSAIEWIEQR
ncbi:MAG: lipoate--protein ligase family protein [Opitutaceae bacterium]|nr:lipoate--protein ligase family protein [Opitutaceae bacterium]